MKIIYTIIVLLLATTGAKAHEIIETVTEVIDGDTFKTTDRGKPVIVRIADIDCPELQQPGGQEAKQFTTKILLGTLISIKTSGKKQNGILTGKVTTNRGRNMAVLLIQKGLAWPVPKTKNNLVTGQCKKSISSKIGIWVNGIPEPPWKYRSRTYVAVAKKKTHPKISLYGDSALDIARDPDGSAVGEGGGMTIASTPKSSPAESVRTSMRQALYNSVPNRTKTTRQQPKKKKYITADDYTIKLSARQSGDYVEFSGRISNGPMCKKLRVSAYADSNQGGKTHVIKVVSFSSGVRSKTFDGKDRHPWYKKSSPKPQWQITSVYASCTD